MPRTPPLASDHCADDQEEDTDGELDLDLPNAPELEYPPVQAEPIDIRKDNTMQSATSKKPMEQKATAHDTSSIAPKVTTTTIAKPPPPKIETVPDTPPRFGDPFKYWDSYSQHEAAATSKFIPTRLPSLDRAIGGYRGTEVVAGESRSGKSSFVKQSAITAMLKDPTLGVILCEYEAAKIDDVLTCMVHMIASVDRTAPGRVWTESEAMRISRAKELIKNTILPRLAILRPKDHTNESGGYFYLRIAINRAVRELSVEQPVERFLIIVDRLQVMPLPVFEILGERWRMDYMNDAHADPDGWRIRQITEFNKSMHERGYVSATIVVSEVRKGDGSKRRRGLDDVLGSVSIGYEADRVYLLERTQEDNDEDVTPINLRVVKARHGREAVIPLRFRHQQFRFDEFEPVFEDSAAPASASYWDKSVSIKKPTTMLADPFAGI